jgi:hypothetical protein
MIGDVVLVGLAARLLVSAVQVGLARRDASADAEPSRQRQDRADAPVQFPDRKANEPPRP